MARDEMIVAGFGWRQGATQASLRAALAAAQAQLTATTDALAPPGPLMLLATAEDKADAPCLQALAAELNLPVCAVPRARIAGTPTLTRSAAVLRLRGSGSVAEAAAASAAALMASPPSDAPEDSTPSPALRERGQATTAHLLHPRAVSPDRLATCALATLLRSTSPLP